MSGTNLATKLRIENIITKELFKNKLQVLTILYRFKTIIVLFYTEFECNS